jgi:alpha-amylase
MILLIIDFGNYNQNGTIETRFGSKTELVNLITKAHTENIQYMQTLSLNLILVDG